MQIIWVGKIQLKVFESLDAFDTSNLHVMPKAKT